MSKSRSHEHHENGDRNQHHAKGKAQANGEPQSIEEQFAVAQEKIERLTVELAQTKDQLLRAFADMQNLRKRFQTERESMRRIATEQFVRELLPVLDNFERTLAAAKSGASVESLVEGISSVDRQIRSILQTHEFERIETEGQLFDPEFHEAVATHETPELPEGTVVAELEPGYKLANVVLRPAKVKVVKRP